jgi:hypothetical protein
MTTGSRRNLRWTAVFLLTVAVAACQKTDVVAPDGSTISLVSTPATIVLAGGRQASPATILAIVSNSIGVPLSGQDVRFTTTSGTLDPVAGTPVRTDSHGNAISILTDATQGPTITAKSGKATQTLQITTATCNLSTITFGPGPIFLNNCATTFDLTATALDTAGDPCQGVIITFSFVPTSTPTTDIGGSFNPLSAPTDVNGELTTTLTIDNQSCTAKCPGTQQCTGSIEASSGTVMSTPPIQIRDTF